MEQELEFPARDLGSATQFLHIHESVLFHSLNDEQQPGPIEIQHLDATSVFAKKHVQIALVHVGFHSIFDEVGKLLKSVPHVDCLGIDEHLGCPCRENTHGLEHSALEPHFDLFGTHASDFRAARQAHT